MDAVEKIESCFLAEYEREHPFCKLIMNMPIIVCELARDGTTLFVNNAISDATGYMPEELIGRNWWDILFPGGSCEQVWKHLDEIEKRDVFNFEMYMTAKDGKQVPILWSSANTYDESGRLEKILSFGTDVTKLKNVQDSLAESEERLRVFSDSTSEGIVIHDHGKILDANRQLLEITGYTMGELERVNCIDKMIVISEQHKVWDIVESESEEYYETIGIKKDGSTVPVGVKGRYIEYMGRPVRVAFIRDLTEQKRAEASLKKERDLLQNLINITPAVISILDRNGRFTFINKEGEKATNLTKEEVVNKRYDELGFNLAELDGSPQAEENEPFNIVKDSEKPVYDILREIGPPHYRRIASINAAPLFDEKSEFDGVVAVSWDITDRIRNEQKLLESEERYRQIAEATSEAIVVHEDGVLVDVNKRFEEMFGYTSDEILETSDFSKLATRESVEGLCKHTQSGSDEPYEINALKKDGTVFPAMVRGRNLKYRGHYARVLSIQDLSELKKAEAELRREKDFFNNIAETSPTGILYFDRSGKAVFANSLIKNLMNLKEDGELDYVFNDPRWDIRKINGESISDEELPFAKVMKTGQSVQNFPVSVKLPNEERICISINNSPMYGENDEIIGVVATIELITERVEAEQKLRSLNRELEERARLLAQSNEDLEKFAFIASHDLKEPLNIIMGFAKLLHKQYKDQLDPKATEFLSFIVDETGRMQNLIKGLLELSRISTRGRPFRKFDANRVLEKALAGLNTMIIENDARITSENLPTITGDEIQIGQVFQNLISNAISFRREGPPEIHISAKKEKSSWLFSVRDNGIGIKSEDREKIFEVFQTGKIGAGEGGTGIGLAICKKIVNRHGGEIWVESEPGKGSTFYFTIPIHNNHEK
jgi:PAS domain S-box-containing protein